MPETAFSAAMLAIRATEISSWWRVGFDRWRLGQRSDGDLRSGGRIGGVSGDHRQSEWKMEYVA
jgi:hypothetical protein